MYFLSRAIFFIAIFDKKYWEMFYLFSANLEARQKLRGGDGFVWLEKIMIFPKSINFLECKKRNKIFELRIQFTNLRLLY